MPNWFVTLPVYNEKTHINQVLDEVRHFAQTIVVVDDGSTDGSTEVLQERSDIILLRHEKNRGYGAALNTAFQFAIQHGYEGVVTIDCDGQHQPQLIPLMVEKLFSEPFEPIDIVSGSRYLSDSSEDVAAPEDRRKINHSITMQLNEILGFDLTDSFCGFKAYRTSALKKLRLTIDGYAMPLQLWIQAACAGMKIVEVPVPRIYLEEKRSFGGSLDDSAMRMQHYQEVIRAELDRLSADCRQIPVLQATDE